MSASQAKQPMSWDDYEYGRSFRQGSTGSLESHVQFREPSTPPGPSSRQNVTKQRSDGESAPGSLRHRGSRSSISSRINTLAQAGGPNSFENFARSWSRAAAFHEIPQRKPSFVVSENEEQNVGHKRSDPWPSPAEPRSLLKQQLESERTLPENAIDDESSHHKGDPESQPSISVSQPSARGASSSSDKAPQISSQFGSSFGGIYGSLPSRRGEAVSRPVRTHEEILSEGRKQPPDVNEPLLVKVIEERDGKKIHVVVGQSTLPQTTFNSVNTLIGIGLLSLPLAFKMSGWLIGIGFVLFAAMITKYTARLLAKCLDLDLALVTFSDIAWKAFGLNARIAVGLVFSIELLGACIALVILFADSLDALVPGYGVTDWKILAGIVLIPLNLVPLRYLSITSVLGILCCFGIVTLTFVDGILTSHAPGSLREPASTSLFPNRWSDLPLSLGLLMAPWGGHGVFPNIYRDMRHPTKYGKAINYTYIFTFSIDIAIAIAGYVMFGPDVRDEVTSNIIMTHRFPRAISICIVVFIAIIPLTKVPLNARPIFVILEDLCDLNAHRFSHLPYVRSSNLAHLILRALIRILVLALIVLLAAVIPGFDTIMELLGSAMAFSICIVLPVAFHVKLFNEKLGKVEKTFNWFLIITCSLLATISTIWVFLPEDIRQRLDDLR